MASSATRTVEVALPAPQAEAALYQAMVAAGLHGVRGGQGTLRGNVPTSWWSWGEDVTAVIAHGPHGAVVQLRSASSYPLTLLDWGKNAKNLGRVLGELAMRAPVVGG